MKPSERRALEAEKRARQAAEWREKELEKEAKKAAKKAGVEYQPKKPEPTDTERINTDAEYTKLPEGEIEVKGDGYHRESFWSNHVRLIAFIVTTVVVLFVIGPLGYDIYLNVKDYKENGARVEGIQMTEADLIALAEKGDKLTWKDLEAYEHKSSNGGKAMEIYVEELGLTVTVERYETDNVYPYFVRLIHYANGTFIDDIRFVKREDIESFIDSPTSGVLSGEDGDFEGKLITIKDVFVLTEKENPIIWGDFEKYERTVSCGVTVMEIKVDGIDFTLKVLRTKEEPSKINVQLVHNECKEYIRVDRGTAKAEIEKFIADHTPKAENETK